MRSAIKRKLWLGAGLLLLWSVISGCLLWRAGGNISAAAAPSLIMFAGFGALWTLWAACHKTHDNGPVVESTSWGNTLTAVFEVVPRLYWGINQMLAERDLPKIHVAKVIRRDSDGWKAQVDTYAGNVVAEGDEPVAIHIARVLFHPSSGEPRHYVCISWQRDAIKNESVPLIAKGLQIGGSLVDWRYQPLVVAEIRELAAEYFSRQ